MNLATQQHLQLQMSAVCNARCRTCPYPEYGIGKTMTDRVFNKVLAAAETSKTKWVSVLLHLQGEPLLDPKLFDRIREIRERLQFKWITVATNCSLLSEENGRKLIDALAGIRSDVRLSFHGTEQDGFENRMGLSWEICRTNIERFLAMSDPVCIKDDLMKRAIVYVGAARGVYGYWQSVFERLGLKREPRIRIFRAASSRAGAVKWDGPMKPATGGKDYLKCWQLRSYTQVNVYGEVIPCCQDWQRRIILGDLMKESLDTICHRIDSRMSAAAKNPDFPCKECECG